MTVMLSPEWGPYRSPVEATEYLGRFVDKACGPGTGIAWTANGNLYPLRAPKRDDDGFGDVVMFEWNKPPPPAPRQVGFWNRVRAFISGVVQMELQSQLQQAEIQRAMGDAMVKAVSRAFTTHQDDGIGVALDVIGIAISIALIPTGLGIIGGIALIGSVFLLGTDTYSYALEMDGEDEGAEKFKRRTERYRLFATVMTLPDVAYGSYKIVKEVLEIKSLRALDAATATAAEAKAARTINAVAADRLHRLADRANLRSQIRTEQLKAILTLQGSQLKLEVGGKVTGAGSIGLMVREEVLEDSSSFHQFLRFLQVHAVTAHAT